MLFKVCLVPITPKSGSTKALQITIGNGEIGYAELPEGAIPNGLYVMQQMVKQPVLSSLGLKDQTALQISFFQCYLIPATEDDKVKEEPRPVPN